MIPKKAISLDITKVTGLIAIILTANLLSMINLPLIEGFRVHFFQVAIFAAAMLYGYKGGLTIGLIGSAYTAIAMSNPYILLFNSLLGLFVGYFFLKGFNIHIAVLFAFAIELLWLIPIDLFIIEMPAAIVTKLVISLLFSNMLWASVANLVVKRIAK